MEKDAEAHAHVERELERIQEEMHSAIYDFDSSARREVRMWKVLQLNHRRTRYLHEMYKEGSISAKFYGACINRRVVDRDLARAWERNGYERACCLICIQREPSSCICRVPLRKMKEPVECSTCGCRGCSGF